MTSLSSFSSNCSWAVWSRKCLLLFGYMMWMGMSAYLMKKSKLCWGIFHWTSRSDTEILLQNPTKAWVGSNTSDKKMKITTKSISFLKFYSKKRIAMTECILTNFKNWPLMSQVSFLPAFIIAYTHMCHVWRISWSWEKIMCSFWKVKKPRN